MYLLSIFNLYSHFYNNNIKNEIYLYKLIHNSQTLLVYKHNNKLYYDKIV